MNDVSYLFSLQCICILNKFIYYVQVNLYYTSKLGLWTVLFEYLVGAST